MAKGDGLIIMKPSSIVVAGGTATINADGGVDFSAATSLSLNGVFGGYDNYLVTYRGVHSTDGASINLRLRASGTDANGANYTWQYLVADGSTKSGARSTGQTYTYMGQAGSSLMSGVQMHLYGPSLAQATAMRAVDGDSYNNAYIFDIAATHSLATAYDGVTLYPFGGAATGSIVVMGYEE